MMGGYGMGMGGGGLLFMVPNWVALVAIIPLGALVLLWVMAFRDKLDGGRA
jgi:hypothetical protein